MVFVKKNNARQQKISLLIRHFLHVSRLHRVMIESEISKLGIHCSQHNMLVLIANSKNICQKDIARELEISSAAVAVTLNKLESSGLIARSQSFDDARMNHITITDKGAELLKTTKEMFTGLDEEFFKGVTDEDIDRMNEVLAKITENLKSNADKD